MIGGWDEGTLARFVEDRLEPLLRPFRNAGRWETGDVKMAAYSTPDAGWLTCVGTIRKRAAYAQLFARIGTSYNTGGEAADEFREPDFRGRSPVGVGTGDATGATAHALGAKVGEQTHLLTGAESGEAGHNHTQNAHQHTTTASIIATVNAGATVNVHGAGSDTTSSTTATNNAVAAASAASAHENRGPGSVVNFFIKT